MHAGARCCRALAGSLRALRRWRPPSSSILSLLYPSACTASPNPRSPARARSPAAPPSPLTHRAAGAFAYLAGNASADYVLFLEKDFAVAPEAMPDADAGAVARELFVAVQLLSRGTADLVRLRGGLDFPSEGYVNCCADGGRACPWSSRWLGVRVGAPLPRRFRAAPRRAMPRHSAEPPGALQRRPPPPLPRSTFSPPSHPPSVSPAPFPRAAPQSGHFSDHQNYLYTLCDPDVAANSSGRVAQCALAPARAAPADVLCYTSADSCWSNNPTLLPRRWFRARLRRWTLENLEYFSQRSHYFELETTKSWVAWARPARVCATRRGLFRHREVDQ